MTRVLVVDDHAMVREGIASILADEDDIEVVTEACSGEDALRQDLDDLDVALIDVRLPGMSGIELCAALHDDHPYIRSLIVTAFASDAVLFSAFEAGARGFMNKSARPSLIVRGVRTVAQDGTFLDPESATRLAMLATNESRQFGPHGLTRSELRIVSLLPKGLTNHEMADELDLTANTVKSHLSHAMSKLGVHTRSEAAAYALREGIG